MNNSSSVWILRLFLVVGFALFAGFLYVDIMNIKATSNYVEVMGEYVSSSSYGTDYLKYEYVVDGNTYYCQTDYSTSLIPKEGSKRLIKYDPNFPSKSYLTGVNPNFIFQFIGVFFFFLALTFLCKKILSRLISILVDPVTNSCALVVTVDTDNEKDV